MLGGLANPLLHRRAPFPLEALLGLDGPDGLGDGLEPAFGDLFSGVLADAVGSLFYLLQGPLDLPEAAFDLLSSTVASISRSKMDWLMSPESVSAKSSPPPSSSRSSSSSPSRTPAELVPEVDEPLPLAVDKLLIQLVVSQVPS